MMKTDSAVRLRGVRFGYRPDRPVLAVDALDVAPGERVFIEGESGSGKSTLLGLVGGILVASEGEVRVFAQSITELSGLRRDRLRADQVGFVFQMFNLLPYLSVVDNVVLPCRFSARRAREALDRSPSLREEALRLLARLGLGDGTIHHRSVTELSIGQQQRVAAARALIGAPALVIADEPTSALDTRARARFVDLLIAEATASQSAVLFASHDRALASRFDRALSMSALNTAAVETTAEV
ncbi:MAG: ATP-binding cassette domain-containing protein [Gammaproteobacteria bacterium]|nr:ATP-binding cassette domain-containing protein [Gammaproteobacteria bacterium]